MVLDADGAWIDLLARPTASSRRVCLDFQKRILMHLHRILDRLDLPLMAPPTGPFSIGFAYHLALEDQRLDPEHCLSSQGVAPGNELTLEVEVRLNHAGGRTVSVHRGATERERRSALEAAHALVEERLVRAGF